MGSKSDAKRLMALAGVPVVPGYGGERQEPYFLKQKAYEIGYPVLIKAVAGGGGRGMRRVTRAIDFDDALAQREARGAFRLRRRPGADRALCRDAAPYRGAGVRRQPRQRRASFRARLLGAAPAPEGDRGGAGAGLSDDDARAALGEIAVKAAAAVGYRGAGTVEFVADASKPLTPESFFFIEMNTRLQVEHPVTEAVTGLDLVEWQLRIAAGEPLPLQQEEIALQRPRHRGAALCGGPGRDFRPSTGRLADGVLPVRARASASIPAWRRGSVVGPYYDAMLAKVIATGGDRREAVERLAACARRHPRRRAENQPRLPFRHRRRRRSSAPAASIPASSIARSRTASVEPLNPALAALRDRRMGGARGAWRPAPPAAHGRASDAFELGGMARRTSIAVEIDGEPVTAQLAWSKDGPTRRRARRREAGLCGEPRDRLGRARGLRARRRPAAPRRLSRSAGARRLDETGER